MNQNKNIIITASIILLVLAGIIWIAKPGSKNNLADLSSVSKGALTAEETAFDFGTISMAAGKVKHVFKIKNTGAESVAISRIYTSCMCTSAILEKGGERFGPYGMPGHGFVPKVNTSVQAGEEATIEVIFDPAAHGPAGVGKIERAVIIENNGGQPLELQFSASVTP